MLRDAWSNDGGKGWWRWWSRLGGLLAMATAISCLVAPFPGASANSEAKRLYDDLLSNYNRLIRPVGNNSDRLTVKMGLRLSQLIDVVSRHPSPPLPSIINPLSYPNNVPIESECANKRARAPSSSPHVPVVYLFQQSSYSLKISSLTIESKLELNISTRIRRRWRRVRDASTWLRWIEVEFRVFPRNRN